MDNQLNPSNDRFWILFSKKLTKEASSEELQEFNILLIQNPDLHHQSDILTEMWVQETKNRDVESEEAYMRHVMKFKDEFFAVDSIEETSPPLIETKEQNEYSSFLFRKKFKSFAIAAVLILITGFVYMFSQSNNDSSSDQLASAGISSVVTKNGNRTKILLPDGSQVWLNAGSSLDYNNAVYNKEIREVTLNGEAYFDVTKNIEKPFIIHTQKMDIKVLGTAFNVRSYSNEKTAEAALIRGSIEVTLKDRKDQKIILKPNEKITVANKEDANPVAKPKNKIPAKTATPSMLQFGVIDLKPNPTYNIIGEIAWTQNKLFFEDEKLEDIGLMIERWFGKKVVINNESLKNVRYYGNYENETVEEVLLSLKLSYPFNFRIENDTVTIY